MKSLACYAYRLYIFDICFSVAVKSGLGSSKLIAVSAFGSRNCIILFQFLRLTLDVGCESSSLHWFSEGFIDK